MLPGADLSIRTRLANEISSDAHKLIIETIHHPSEPNFQNVRSPNSVLLSPA
jgi:hypothetical protein